MKVSAILFAATLAGSLFIAQTANSQDVSQNPTGLWQSVDFVEHIENFKPGQKSWQHELFVKEVEFRTNGKINPFPAFNWNNDSILDSVSKVKARFYIRQINGSTYMFFPWLSGDVTSGGQKPRYYVLKKVSNGSETQDTSLSSEQSDKNMTGRWISIDLVKKIDDFNPDKKNWQEELFFKQVEFFPDGTTDSFFRWKDDWILHMDGKTKAQFYLKQINGQAYLFLPWLSGDVTIRNQKPVYYVLRKIPAGEQPQVPSTGNRAGRGAFGPIEPVNSVKEFDDVRDKDLSGISPAEVAAVIDTLKFNKDTIWPRQNLPPGKRPEKLLEDAMNPGLGIRYLHKQGITGKGVNVAIIDQPLYQDHPEFAGKIAEYFDTGCNSESSMHGPSVASLLVGTNCGTAPDAKVFYAAAPSWLKDSAYFARALDWIIEQNAKLPADRKIRVVSVSAAPSGPGSPFEKNQQMWDDACSRAEAAGILVLDCTSHHGFIRRCFLDAVGRENPSRCSSDISPGQKFDSKNDILFAPSGPRTMAEEYQKGRFTYQYNARGGVSWAIPYVAGVLAMGWQVNPRLGPEQMKEMLLKSAAKGQNGEKVINPRRFIAMVKMAKPDTASPAPRREPRQNPDQATAPGRQRRSEH